MLFLCAAYRLYTVVPRLVKFVDMLTNWYVRTNRRRLKVRHGTSENKSMDTDDATRRVRSGSSHLCACLSKAHETFPLFRRASRRHPLVPVSHRGGFRAPAGWRQAVVDLGETQAGPR